MTKSTKMKTVVAVAVAAIFVGIFIKDYLAIGSKARARRVFIENTSSSVVEVELSGGSTHSCTLAPSASCLVEVEAEAAYTISSKVNGQEMQRDSFTFPPAQIGADALYIVGPLRPYALITMAYGNYSGSSVRVDPTEPFTMLPRKTDASELNAPFPDALTTSSTGGTLTHLCHYDPTTDEVGCPGG